MTQEVFSFVEIWHKYIPKKIEELIEKGYEIVTMICIPAEQHGYATLIIVAQL